MREIITITGDVGSGKSTFGKIIAESLGFKLISTGVILREIAELRGQTIVQINEALMKERKIDNAKSDKQMYVSLFVRIKTNLD